MKKKIKNQLINRKKLYIYFFIPLVIIFIPLLYLAIIKLIPDMNKLLVLILSILTLTGSILFYLSFELGRKNEAITKKEALSETILYSLVIIGIVFLFWYMYLR